MFLLFTTLILIILLMIAAEVEGGGPFIFFGSLVAYLWIGNFLEPVWSFTTTNVVGIVVGICSYLILGAIWSFFKWYKYVSITTNYPLGFSVGQHQLFCIFLATSYSI